MSGHGPNRQNAPGGRRAPSRRKVRSPAAKTSRARRVRARQSADRPRPGCHPVCLAAPASRPDRWSTTQRESRSRASQAATDRRGPWRARDRRQGPGTVPRDRSRSQVRRPARCRARCRRPGPSASRRRPTRSAPVVASSGIRSSVTPPDTSVFARPATIATAWRISGVVMLSSRMMSAPASAASDASATVWASTSTGRPGEAARAFARAWRDTAGQPDVVVLDQDQVEQPEAMVARRRRPARCTSPGRAGSAWSCACRAP